MPLFGLVIVIVEAWEHVIVRESLFTMHFFTEVLIYGISIPIFGAFLLTWIDKVELDRDLALSELSQKDNFSRQMRNASSWDDLVGLIAEFPGTIMPVTSTSVFVNNADRDDMELVGAWRPEGYSNIDPVSTVNLEQCQSCKMWSAPLTGLYKCPSLPDAQSKVGSEWYCMPIAFKNYLTGILTITLPEKQNISNQQLRTLRDITPEIALALENYYLHNIVQARSEDSIAERKRIAQDLHDTLGQNLSYLRLKLDQISEQDSLLSIGEIENDLTRMRDIADEAYLQMRETLANLHSSATIELEESLRAHAENVAARANFKVEFICKGEAVPLRPHVKRQVLYICREALNNVEKHANASSVKIELTWDQEDLTLKITDNGSGIHPQDLESGSHLGMGIMSERAEEINGHITLNSQAGQGTSLSLFVPLTNSLIRV